MHTVPRLYENFHPSHYDLQLDIDRGQRTFTGIVTITGDKISDSAPLIFHAKDLTITSVQVDDRSGIETKEAAYDQLSIVADISAGTHTITMSFQGNITDGMHGLYPCYYTVNGAEKELLATQFESHHAREVFPCIDEPEAKASFSLTLTTEAGVEVLSNMPATSSATHAERTVTTFEKTPRMSTYLLAFVTGELQKLSATTKSGVEVNIWATFAQPKASLTFPLEVAVRSIEFFDEYFGIHYPLPKADHVALPDFSSGAMENWGLITYREIALLVDQNSSISTKEYVATVIAHETSHQWFGNLVTMQWWDDLWLNESFATIMEYVAVDSLYPHWNVWNTFASQESLSALRRDQLAGVQAVKCEVKHPDEISTLFDPSIVYAKGGRLLKMLRSYIGDDAFRQGLQAYFQKHAYGNTTGNDLWQAFSESSGKNIEAFMNAWLTQSGFPVVAVQTTDSGYMLTQERFVVGDKPDESLWPIPLFAQDAAFPELLSSKNLTISADHTSPLLNRHNDAHFVAQYDEEGWTLIRRSLASGDLDPISRLSLLHETSLLARGGKTDTATLLPLIDSYAHETSEPVWSIIAMVLGDLKRFVEDHEPEELLLKARIRRLALPLYETLGFTRTSDESEEHTKLRAIIIGLLSYAEDPAVLEASLDSFRTMKDALDLESETRATILATAAKHGNQEDFDRLLSLHETTSNPELRDDLTSGLCATRSETNIARLLERLTRSELVKQQDVFRWFIYLLRNRYARRQAWQWMTENWHWIEKTYKGDKSYDDFARYSAGVFATKEWLETYRAFFTPLRDQTVLQRAIDVGLTEIQSRAEWLDRDRESVLTILAQETQ